MPIFAVRWHTSPWAALSIICSSRTIFLGTGTFSVLLKRQMLFNVYKLFTMKFFEILVIICKSFGQMVVGSSLVRTLQPIYLSKVFVTKLLLLIALSKMAFAREIIALSWRAFALFCTLVGFLRVFGLKHVILLSILSIAQDPA